MQQVSIKHNLTSSYSILHITRLHINLNAYTYLYNLFIYKYADIVVLYFDKCDDAKHKAKSIKKERRQRLH